MLNYALLSKKPSIFRNFTDLEVAEFEDLNSQIKIKHAAFEQKQLSRENRKREIGAGHPFKLSVTDSSLCF
jgi:hypothetical protein